MPRSMTDVTEEMLRQEYIKALQEGTPTDELEKEMKDWYGPNEWPAKKEALENEASFGNAKAQ